MNENSTFATNDKQTSSDLPLVSVDFSNLYQPRAAHGVAAATTAAQQQIVAAAQLEVNKNIKAGKYGFVNVVQSPAIVQLVQNSISQFSWANFVVIIGIGGSDLGARAIQQALAIPQPISQSASQSGQRPKIIFSGDTTDSHAYEVVKSQIIAEETLFVVISKSGTTVETISSYMFWQHFCQENTLSWNKHFLFITDPNSGLLHDQAQQHQVATLPIPGDVGGRFSVLTAVGLLPAGMMGVNLSDLVEGARLATVHHLDTALEIASSQFALLEQGLPLAVLMPYSSQLNELARWYRQLWAESLGKEGKGILPIQAYGPADQHSQLQFYAQGKLLSSVWFMKINQAMVDLALPNTDIAAAKYLSGTNLQDILKAEQESTALALTEIGRPNATITIEKITPQAIGELFMIFELAVVYLAAMLGVNAFDQPGVEQSKQMMYALLGHPDYAEMRAKIQQIKKI